MPRSRSSPLRIYAPVGFYPDRKDFQMKWVSLEPEQWAELEATMQSPECDKRYWKRLYSVKLNAQGYSLVHISDLLEVHYNSVYQWIRRYEEEGVAGLKDHPISGRPPLLSEADRSQVEAFIRDTPQQPKVVLARVEAELGKSISRATLRRTLKALDRTYRRVKKSLRSKRNEREFEVKKKEIEALKIQEDNGEIDLYFYDESGFSLVPNVPYCWQKKGETIELPSSKSKTLQVLGFVRRDQTFRFYYADGTVDSVTMVAVFEDFISTLDAQKKSVIVMDNASPHVSAYFEANKALWEEQNVAICNLSTYSPELNIIEILWRFVKYVWLPFDAYFSVETLEEKLTEVLLNIGKKFTISFA